MQIDQIVEQDYENRNMGVGQLVNQKPEKKKWVFDVNLNGSQMLDVRCQMLDVRCQKFDVKQIIYQKKTQFE